MVTVEYHCNRRNTPRDCGDQSYVPVITCNVVLDDLWKPECQSIIADHDAEVNHAECPHCLAAEGIGESMMGHTPAFFCSLLLFQTLCQEVPFILAKPFSFRRI